MALLNAAALKKLSDSSFAYIDSSGGRHLPIQDAEHTRNAMARFNQTQFESDAAKASARSKILAAAKKFGIDVSKFANPLSDIFDTLAKKVSGKKAEMSDVTLEATFAVESEEEDGDDLILKGRLFKAGDYPVQSFSMTPVELHEVLERFFGPVPMDLHHKSSLFANADLRGQLGQVEDIWTDDSGEWLMAKARKPKWLHEVMPETKVSATFAREPKQLIATAWTHDPVVSDAQLVAAFAKHNTPTGQYRLQDIHDATVRGGAVCNKPAAMASKHENAAIQQAHDLTTEHGAQCENVKPGQSMPAMYANDQRPRSKRMNVKVKEFLLGKAKEDGIELDEADIEAAFSSEPDPAVAEMQLKLKAAEDRAAALEAAQETHNATFARLETERRESAAATFAKDQVIAGRISPAAQGPLAALTVRILEADSTATFADGEKSNTALLKEVLDALESDFKIFTKNTVGDDAGPFAALFAETTTKGVNGEAEPRPEVLKRMRAATAEGRAIAAEQNGKN